MTWHATEMPDDALDPSSYVGRMLNADPVRPEPVADAAELPLWMVMEQADCNFGDSTDIARQIEALRDWIPRRPPKAFYEEICRELGNYDVTMAGRTMDWVLDLLTDQARIARGER